MIQIKDFARHEVMLCRCPRIASGIRLGGVSMQKKVTWILVADGARARVLMNDGAGKGLQPTADGDLTHSLPPTRELGTDRPGRPHQRDTSARQPIQPHVDWRRFEKEKFSKELASLLDAAAERGAFHRLV